MLQKPRGHFHVVEFGALHAENLTRLSQLKRNKGKLFVAVDPAYHLKGRKILKPGELGRFKDTFVVDLDMKNNANPVYKVARPGGKIISVSGTMESFIELMKKKGLRSDELHVRMPDPYNLNSGNFKLENIFRDAHNLLPQNGRIIISTNHENILREVQELAKRYGLVGRKRPASQTIERTVYERHARTNDRSGNKATEIIFRFAKVTRK